MAIITSIYSIKNDRNTQEDTTISSWIDDNHLGKILVLGVFDGHGGDYVSTFLQNEFIKIFKNCLEKNKDIHDINTISSALKDSLLQADSEIPVEYSDHGSTATVAIFVQDMLIVANIGDSRIVCVKHDENNTVTQLSYDHNIKNSKEFDRVKDVIYFGRVCGILAMTRAIGDHTLRPSVSGEPDIFMYKLNPDDTIILATDGLWDTVDNSKVGKVVYNVEKRCLQKECTKPLELACRIIPKILVKEAIINGSRDNISVIIARYSSVSNIYSMHSY